MGRKVIAPISMYLAVRVFDNSHLIFILHWTATQHGNATAGHLLKSFDILSALSKDLSHKVDLQHNLTASHTTQLTTFSSLVKCILTGLQQQCHTSSPMVPKNGCSIMQMCWLFTIRRGIGLGQWMLKKLKVLTGEGMERGVPIHSLLDGVGSIVSSPSWVQGAAPSLQLTTFWCTLSLSLKETILWQEMCYFWQFRKPHVTVGIQLEFRQKWVRRVWQLPEVLSKSHHHSYTIHYYCYINITVSKPKYNLMETTNYTIIF